MGATAAVVGDESGSEDRQRSWGMGEAAVGWVLAQVAATITFVSVFAASGADDTEDLSLGWIVIGQTGLWATFVAVPYVAARWKGNGFVEDFGIRAKAVDLV